MCLDFFVEPLATINREPLRIHAEVPKRDDDAMPRLYVVLYDASVLDIFYLFLAFLLATDLKGIAIDGEVGNFRGGDVLLFSRI